MRSISKFIGMSSNDKKIKQKAEEETYILATRFLTFSQKALIITRYLPQKPVRNYGSFASNPGERSRPIPEIMWDSLALEVHPLQSLRQIRLLNYDMVAKLDDPDESMVTIELVLAEVNKDRIPIVGEDEIMPFDNRLRKNYQLLINERSV